MYQNQRIHFDEIREKSGCVRQVPKDYTVYKDMMIFKTVIKGNYFGGRALVANRDKKNTVRNIFKESLTVKTP